MTIVVSRSTVPASFIALTFLLAPLAWAQEPVQRVEITGSSIKRIEGETALPVQVITRKELEQSGATNVEQFMQGLGVALQGNSNSVAATASGATTGGVSSISLRGLGSQRTLVLIDGKRVSAGGTLTDSTSVDINLIPLAAVERVEVLKDGASAVYGSEAIAGVVNFILRKDYRGAEAGGYTALTQHPGGRGWGVNYLLGLGDMGTKGWNFTGTIDVRHEDAIFGRDRSFASSGINTTYFNDVTSGNTFPGNVALAPSGASTRNPAAPGLIGTPGSIAPPACPGPYSNVDPFFSNLRCRFDPSPLVSLIPKTDTTGLFGGMRFKLTGNHELYGQAGYTHKEQETIIQPVPISDQFALPASHPLANVFPYNITGSPTSTILLTPASAFYPTAFANAQYGGTPNLLVRYRSAETGNRDLTDIADFFRLVGGIRGTFVGWDYDASLLHVQTNLREVVNNGFPSLAAILPVLNGGNFNPFGPQPATTEAQIQASQFRGDAWKTKTTTDSAAGKVSRDLTRLPGGPLGFAVGVEERREGFKLDTPPIIQIGDISGYGGNFLPVDVSRRVTSGFTEINAPVIRGLEGLAAVRYDNYEGTGSKISPKLGVRWQPIRQALFRGSVGKGFRAPSLTELDQPQTIGVTANGVTDPARCPTDPNACSTQFPITLGGNTGLRPETSINRSIGFVLEPVNNISAGVDYWEVDLSNTIIFGISPQFILDNEAKFPGFVTRGAPNGACPGCPGPITNIAQTNTNLGETHVKGFDFTGLWRIPMRALGALTFNFNGTYMYRYEIQNLDGSFSSVNGMVSPITQGNGGVIPRWRHYLTADWALNPWNFAAVWQYQSHYKDIPGTFDPGAVPVHEFVSDYSLLHVYASYSGLFNRNLQLTAGIRNVFDKNPPYSNAGGQNYFQAGYDPGYADPRGRTFLLQAKFKFQ